MHYYKSGYRFSECAPVGKVLVQSRFVEKLERGLDLQHHVRLRDVSTRLPVSHRRLPEVRRLLAAKG